MIAEVEPRTEVIEFRNTIKTYLPILVGTPTLGTVRIEWANARQGIVVPTNWAQCLATPTGYLVDDAQNLLVQAAVDRKVDWLLLLEDDTIPPPELYLKLRVHMESRVAPVISGLYYIKGSNPPEPLIYKGRGNGAFRNWAPDSLVWCDGVPTGCILIHKSIFVPLHEKSEEYELPSASGPIRVRRVFESPRKVIYDGPFAQTLVGTSDLQFCERVMQENLIKFEDWKIESPEFPFLVDTSIKCGHIDRESGMIY